MLIIRYSLGMNSSMRFTEHKRTKLKQDIALFVTSFGTAVTHLRKSDEGNNTDIKNSAAKAHHVEIINYLLEVSSSFDIAI